MKAFKPYRRASVHRSLGRVATVVALVGIALLSACSKGPSTEAKKPAASAAPVVNAIPVRIAPLLDPNYLTLTKYASSADSSVAAAGGVVEWKPTFPAFAPTAEALRGGSVDVGSGSSTSFLSSLGGNSDLVVFAVEQDSGKGQGIVATGASGIKKISDLVGKKVAINKGGTGEYLFRLALVKNNIPLDKVQFVYLAPTDAATAFSQGEVDAWAVWDQFFATAQAVPGAHVVAYGADVGSLNRIVHVTTRKFADEHPVQLKAVFDALKKESDESQKNTGRIAELAAQRGVPKDVIEIIRQVPPARIVPADATTKAEFAEIAKFFADQQLTKALIDVSATTVDVTQAK